MSDHIHTEPRCMTCYPLTQEEIEFIKNGKDRLDKLEGQMDRVKKVLSLGNAI